MSQRIDQISLIVEDGCVQVKIYGENGAELIYSGNGADEIVGMFDEMRNSLRRDMDYYDMVPSGSVTQVFSECINDWPDFSYVIDDLYLGQLTDDVREWCDSLCEEASSGPVAYACDIAISFDAESKDVFIDLYWNSSDSNWSRYGLSEPNGYKRYAASDYGTVNGMIYEIASNWASDFLEKGVSYEGDPELYLPEYGPEANEYAISGAFRDLWEGNNGTSDVSVLEDYLNEFMNSSVPGGYVDSIDIDVDSENDGVLVIRIAWDTYDNPEWNAILPTEEQGVSEYYSDSYGTISDMFDALSRELQPTFAPAGIEYNPEMATIRYAATEGPVIYESEFSSAFNDLFHGVSYSSCVTPVVEKLQQMISDHQGYPITSIVYNINDAGGDITFFAEDFEASYTIYEKESVIDTLNEIAKTLEGNCRDSYVTLDSDSQVDIIPGYNNTIDISLSGFDHEDLFEIFLGLYEGNVTERAEKLSNWISSM